MCDFSTGGEATAEPNTPVSAVAFSDRPPLERIPIVQHRARRHRTHAAEAIPTVQDRHANHICSEQCKRLQKDEYPYQTMVGIRSCLKAVSEQRALQRAADYTGASIPATPQAAHTTLDSDNANKQTVSVQHDNAILTTGQRPISNAAETTALAETPVVGNHKRKRNAVTAEGQEECKDIGADALVQTPQR